MQTQRRVLGHGVVVVCLLALLTSPLFGKTSSTKEQGLQALEAVVRPFATFDAFLRDKAAVKRYGQLLTEYYQRDRFPCESYQEVLSEIRRWTKEEPRVAIRLWSTKPQWQMQVVFKPTGGSTQLYRLVRPPRAFHAVWDDLSRGGCSTTPCGAPSLNAPPRWAAALEGTELFHLERAEAFTGSALVMTGITDRKRQYRLVTTSEDPIFQVSGTVEKKGARHKTTLLQEWAKAVGGTEPLVVAATQTLRVLQTRRSAGPVASFSFADPMAKRLSLVQPERCEKFPSRSLAVTSAPTGATPGAVAGGGPGGRSTTGSAGALSFPTSPEKAAAFQAVLRSVQSDPSAKTLSTHDPVQTETLFQNVLNNSTTPAVRAQAALGLNLMSTGNGFQPSTRTALTRALQDPSPQVRAQAALTLGNGYGPEAFATANNLGLGAPYQRQMQEALNNAFHSPQSVAIPGPPPLQPYTSPDAMRDRAYNGLINQEDPLDPKTRKELLDEASAGSTPNAREKAIEELAKDYVNHTQKGNASQAFEQLQRDLRERPELTSAVIARITSLVQSDCPLCKRP